MSATAKVMLKGEVQQATKDFVLKALKHMFVGLNYWPYENPLNIMTCDIIIAWNLIWRRNLSLIISNGMSLGYG